MDALVLELEAWHASSLGQALGLRGLISARLGKRLIGVSFDALDARAIVEIERQVRADDNKHQ